MCISNIQVVCTTLLKNMDADYTEKFLAVGCCALTTPHTLTTILFTMSVIFMGTTYTSLYSYINEWCCQRTTPYIIMGLF